MNGEPDLIAVVVCEDVLANPSGRLTLYNLFQDLTADLFPAVFPRLHVVTTWYNPMPEPARAVIQAGIVAPDGTAIGNAAATITVAPNAYHTQISRFQGLIFPVPGDYRVQVQRGSRQVCDLPLVVVAPEEEREER